MRILPDGDFSSDGSLLLFLAPSLLKLLLRLLPHLELQLLLAFAQQLTEDPSSLAPRPVVHRPACPRFLHQICLYSQPICQRSLSITSHGGLLVNVTQTFAIRKTFPTSSEAASSAACSHKQSVRISPSLTKQHAV